MVTLQLNQVSARYGRRPIIQGTINHAALSGGKVVALLWP